MKIQLNFILLFIYLISISFLLKKIQLIAFIFLILLFLADKFVHKKLKNSLYILIALIPFPIFLWVFVIYIPYIVFGTLLKESSFMKRYLLGFSLSIFSTLLIYTLSMFIKIPLNTFTIALIFYMPVLVMIIYNFRKISYKKLLHVDNIDFKVLLIVIFLFMYVSGPILTDNTLFMSNGTYFYSKYYMAVKSLEKDHTFPFYSPNAAQGEPIFLIDSPGFYSHVSLIKMLLPSVNPVLYFNYFQGFILFLTVLGMCILLRIILDVNLRKISPYLIGIGGSVIVLNFLEIQLLESIKHFLANPVGLLLFSIVLSNIRNFKDFFILLPLLLLTFMIHPAQSVANGLMVLFLFIGTQLNKDSITRNFKGFIIKVKNQKILLTLLIIVLLLLPLFYFLPILSYSGLLRTTHIDLEDYVPGAMSYLNAFFINENIVSKDFPDPNRNDDRKVGLFISIIGIVSVIYSLTRFRNIYFRKSNIFIFAFLLSTFSVAFLVSFPFFSNMEIGNRTMPYQLAAFIFAFAALTNSFKKPGIRWALLGVLIIGYSMSLPLIKTNFSNVHGESMIAGQSYMNEIDFIKNLPTDGRIITYGHFSNAVDAGLHSLTDKYLARYEFKQLDRSRTIYDMIHTSHSFGIFEGIEDYDAVKFTNLLRKGGYKYVFLNICHPIGQVVANKIYPNASYPIYQNPANQCNLILAMNDTYYIEKVNVVSEQESSDFNFKEGGYLYVAYNNRFEQYYDKTPENPEGSINEDETPLAFTRPKPTHIIVEGDFNDNEWIVFKEQFYPRWKSYIDGKVVPVYATDNDLVLIKTIEGNKLEIIHEISPIEKYSGIVSSIGILLFFLGLIFFI